MLLVAQGSSEDLSDGGYFVKIVEGMLPGEIFSRGMQHQPGYDLFPHQCSRHQAHYNYCTPRHLWFSGLSGTVYWCQGTCSCYMPS